VAPRGITFPREKNIGRTSMGRGFTAGDVQTGKMEGVPREEGRVAGI